MDGRNRSDVKAGLKVAVILKKESAVGCENRRCR